MDGVSSQYQEELPAVQALVRRFDIEVGHCSRCRRRVQGRHALQTSDALGAAAPQLGPNAAALLVELHTELGMPLEKVARVLDTQVGLRVTKGGLVQLLHRTAAKAAPTYAALCEQVRRSPVVTPDETGWRVWGLNHWLWVFATPETTVYAICDGRGSSMRRRFSAPTSPACWCGMVGWPIAASRTHRTRRAWVIMLTSRLCRYRRR